MAIEAIPEAIGQQYPLAPFPHPCISHKVLERRVAVHRNKKKRKRKQTKNLRPSDNLAAADVTVTSVSPSERTDT